MSDTLQPPESLTSDDWTLLCGMIRLQKCVPFLGFGVYSHGLTEPEAVVAASAVTPNQEQGALAAALTTSVTGPEHPAVRSAERRIAIYGAVAERFARSNQSPLKDKTDLARVVQYYAMRLTSTIAKAKIADMLREMPFPCFDDPNEPHRVMADLKLPLYVTTNYSNCMFEALKRDALRDPQRDYCRWDANPALSLDPQVIKDDTELSIASPTVYHLHGYVDKPASLVITEDDYLDFVFNIAHEPNRIPKPIRAAWSTSTLMFLGYNLADWDFRVLLRSILLRLGNNEVHMSVQLTPSSIAAAEVQIGELHQWLGRFFDTRLRIKVFWGSSSQFITRLRQELTARGMWR
jgi:hypothetical protein